MSAHVAIAVHALVFIAGMLWERHLSRIAKEDTANG